eukprot:3449648-Rhodomonas_salina.1
MKNYVCSKTEQSTRHGQLQIRNDIISASSCKLTVLRNTMQHQQHRAAITIQFCGGWDHEEAAASRERGGKLGASAHKTAWWLLVNGKPAQSFYSTPKKLTLTLNFLLDIG